MPGCREGLRRGARAPKILNGITAQYCAPGRPKGLIMMSGGCYVISMAPIMGPAHLLLPALFSLLTERAEGTDIQNC